jgi:hypothetical protein
MKILDFTTGNFRFNTHSYFPESESGKHFYVSGMRTIDFWRIFDEFFQFRFNISADDVLVFLHIQKTAGTSFEKFLVKNLNISKPCDCNMGKKKCSCYRPNSRHEVWLFSRYSTGWVCGLHADFTELYVSGCVEHVMDKREGKWVKSTQLKRGGLIDASYRKKKFFQNFFGKHKKCSKQWKKYCFRGKIKKKFFSVFWPFLGVFIDWNLL